MTLLPVWRTDEPGFRASFDALMHKLSLDEGLLAAGARGPESPEDVVRHILADVRWRGDAALVEGVEEFDGCRLEQNGTAGPVFFNTGLLKGRCLLLFVCFGWRDIILLLVFF